MSKRYYSVDSLVEDTMPENVKRIYFEMKDEERRKESAYLTALESVIEQCDRSLEACLRWPQVSKNEHLNGVQASRAAIKKVKEGK